MGIAWLPVTVITPQHTTSHLSNSARTEPSQFYARKF